MPNLFRFICLVTLSLLFATPAFAGTSAGKEAERTGYAYIKKMAVECNGLTYLKSGDDMREYKGAITISLHEPPSKNLKQGIEWSGGYEINAPNERMNFQKEGWTDELPMPLLFSVKKIRGQWQASGLLKVTCHEIERVSTK
jgi:hypothetical protein